MGFTEDIAKLSDKVCKNADHVLGEEATKMAFIAPFFSALGYDISEPTEVMPEYVADFATKGIGPLKKVDYAIAINGAIIMLVEAKARGQKAEAHDGQIQFYFNGLLGTKVGIVTNGSHYRFFTDLEHINRMDKEPFFSFDILKYDLKDIENLKFFHRDNFDATAIGQHAEEMVYIKSMTKLVGDLLRSPSKEFMHFLLSQLELKGIITNRKIKKFEPIIKKSIQNSLVELMTRSINQEIAQPMETNGDVILDEVKEIQEKESELTIEDPKVETTAEELEAFEKSKAIAATSKIYHLEVSYKDVVAYFGLHVGNAHWWFIRLYLSPKKKSFVTRLSVNEVKSLAPNFEVQELAAPLGGAASKVIISSVSDLDKLAPLILKCYETEAAKH